MRPPRFTEFVACLPSPPPPLPSDYSAVVPLLYGGLAAVTVVALVVIVLSTRTMTHTWSKLFLRVLPFTVLWTFSPVGNRGDWWPAPFGLLFGHWDQRLFALAFMLSTTGLAFAICALAHFVTRRAPSSRS